MYFGTPMGGIPSAPIPVKVPNDLGLEPGETTELWYFDGVPTGGSGEWKVAGTGTVTPDGKFIVTDAGGGVPRFCGVCGLFCFADNQDRAPNPPCDDCEPGAPPQGAGNPITLATGQELESATDLVLDGDPPIVIARRFNPFDAFGYVANYTQSLGVNWTLNYDVALPTLRARVRRRARGAAPAATNRRSAATDRARGPAAPCQSGGHRPRALCACRAAAAR